MVSILLLVALAQQLPGASGGETIQSGFSSTEWSPVADPDSPEWSRPGPPGVQAANDFYGRAVALPPTEVRSRWTRENLHLLFICPYHQLYLKANPVTTQETNKLWDWDVAEAFIGSDFEHIGRYKEFEVSPQGEFVDLDINREDPKAELGIAWQSGFVVKARVDSAKKIWYGEMRIPFASLGTKTPKAGDEFRIGLFRIEGSTPNRIYVAWRPTGAKTFHVPAVFGRLVLK